MKICFIAPSYYGKTTATEIIKKHFNSENIKIAKPLYELQKHFYQFIDRDIKDKQDGELLQFLGQKIRKENPRFLLERFFGEVNNSQNPIIINDDCRPLDYAFLKEMGFIFIKINGFRRDRQDHIEINLKNTLEWQEEIKCDYELDNYSTLLDYEKNILNLMKEIIENEKMLHNSNGKMF